MRKRWAGIRSRVPVSALPVTRTHPNETAITSESGGAKLPPPKPPSAGDGMGAAGPSAKKKRSDELEAHESPPPAMAAREAPNPQPTAKKKRSSHSSQEPAPPRAAGRGGVGGRAGEADRISGLPDAILGEIISLLPTKDGARTQVLASRWRHLWRAAPLNLDSIGFPAEDCDAYARAVSRILSTHRGPGRRFRVAAHLIHSRPDTVDAWLRSPALDNLQEIDFYHRSMDPYLLRPSPSPPPGSISRFSGSLRVATFSKCHIPDGLAETLRFPELKQLGIEKFDELIIEDAPCLEKLLYADRFGICLSVVAAPKLTTLGCPSDTHRDLRILFGATEFQGLNTVSLTTVMRSVKILAVHLWIFDLDKVIDLMKCFPCLEKLYMKGGCNSTKANFWRRKHRLLLKSLDIHLKTVVLECYRGINGLVRFASFFF
ncbi:unnamed protein product [Urochloa decumbens]|uniref:F-box/LRR-repeat protein 15/At3g58940/PEG3-like LRR domain-containing protein n=1 Tax=Urochloa decumbens TaxID=240449 RepID=A0ABC8W1C0_9POAL